MTQLMTTTAKLKVYMAGPDVFLYNWKEVFEVNKSLLVAHGFIPLSPMEDEPGLEVDERGLPTSIYRGNVAKIRRCDLVLANINDFRGGCIDDGTAFEIGAATILGKDIYGYRTDMRMMTQRLAVLSASTRPHDGQGMTVEGFGLPVNLMIGLSVTLVHGGFKEAVERAATDMKTQHDLD